MSVPVPFANTQPPCTNAGTSEPNDLDISASSFVV